MKVQIDGLLTIIDGICLNDLVTTADKYYLPMISAIGEDNMWIARFSVVTGNPIIDDLDYAYSDMQTKDIHDGIIKHQDIILDKWRQTKSYIKKLINVDVNEPISVRYNDFVNVLFADGIYFSITVDDIRKIAQTNYTNYVEYFLGNSPDFNNIGATISNIDGENYVFLDAEHLVFLTRSLCEGIAAPKHMTDEMANFFSYDDVVNA